MARVPFPAALLPLLIPMGVGACSPPAEEPTRELTEEPAQEPPQVPQPGLEASQERPSFPAPPRHKVAGLRGILHRSRVLFAAYPDHPYQLEVSFAFPQRARSMLSSEKGRVAERALHYRFGEAFWRVSSGQQESQELTGLVAGQAMLELELRRALFLWPNGFEWVASGETGLLRAEVEGLGHLEARMAEAETERPVEMTAYDVEDSARESFTNVTWIQRGPRWGPDRFEVQFRDSLVWREEVLEVNTDARYLDAWYIPPDRRPKARSVPVRACNPFQLGPMVFQRHPLPSGTEVSDAIARAQSLRAQEGPALLARGLVLSSSAHVELGPGGDPQAVLLVLEGQPPEPWPGDSEDAARWQHREGARAMGRFLPSPRFSGSDLRQLQKAGEGASLEDGALFLRVQPPDQDPRRAELVLRLGPLVD